MFCRLTIFYIIFFFIGLVTKIDAQSLFWLDASFFAPKISTSHTDGSFVLNEQLDAESLPENIVWSSKENTIYWSELDYSGARINHVGTLLSGYVPLFSGGSVFRGIAVDNDSNWIYIASSNMVLKPRIERIHPDGTSHQVFLKLDTLTGNPRAIAIDPKARKIYWTEFTQGKIKRANLDAGAIPQDVVTGLDGPVGLAVDPSAQKLFWTEANANVLKSSDINGSGIVTLASGLATPNYLTEDSTGGMLYWTEIGVPRIRRANLNGSSMQTLPITVTHPTGIVFVSGTGNTSVTNSGVNLPLTFSIDQNYPNPFNPSTTIRYNVPYRSKVYIVVYNMLGQAAAVLVNNDQEAGVHTVVFHASELPSGVYFYKMQAGGFSEIRKMMILK